MKNLMTTLATGLTLTDCKIFQHGMNTVQIKKILDLDFPQTESKKNKFNKFKD